MTESIIGLPPPGQRFQDWLATPAGRYLLQWEAAEFDRAVADMFGYHALQLGLPELHSLRNNRMTNTWLSHELIADTATEIIAGRTSLGADPAALPFAQNSLDLLTLPHTLELSGDPHMTLSEAHRVLIPEGRVVICGLNPQSLWGFRQHFVPETQEWISLRRLRDWLRLLSFEVESVRFGCYRPALDSGAGLAHSRCLDAIGPKWWPIFGAAYFVVAVKRVRGVTRLTRAKWTRPSLNVAPLPVANNAIK